MSKTPRTGSNFIKVPIADLGLWHNPSLSVHSAVPPNRFLASKGEANVKTWVVGFTPCASCTPLTRFLVPSLGGTLNNFGSVTEIGNDIVDWHNENHANIALAGGLGGCGGPDMGCIAFAPRDP